MSENNFNFNGLNNENENSRNINGENISNQASFSTAQNTGSENTASYDASAFQQSTPENKAVNQPKAPKEKKSRGRVGFAAGIIAAALVVGGGAGFAGTVLGNNIGTISMPELGGTSGQQSDTASDSDSSAATISKPESTIDTSKTTAITPLDENKISDKTNSTLLNAEELYEKVKNTVVVLYNYQNVQGYSEPVKAGYASGIVFTSDGYIITNAHVVSGATKMTAIIPDYNNPEETHEYEATIVGSDTASDLAVLKVERSDPFEFAVLGDSDTVRVGQDICVLGNPKTLTSSLTKGIVSGLDRASYTGSTYACSSIQIDAAINSGNSGGGLFDMYGNIIGVIDYKLSTTSTSQSSIENIGFAITINEAKPVINDLMTNGYVTNRPGLGINGTAISEYSAYMYGISSAGIYVTYISDNKPVANSGLRIGDIITAINDTEVSSLNDVQTEVAKHNIGDTVELTVYRQNEVGSFKKLNISVELGELTLD